MIQHSPLGKEGIRFKEKDLWDFGRRPPEIAEWVTVLLKAAK